ncbi:hypothetical protein L3X38_002598 [Prunus dulcis]|uniref:Transposase MuDR plant domain-containing protein n=1 Tax=Prunus dulcis TaxID=3755 RepID=A0AAD4WU97_PRUDU|nr:hypothetical protein L3X38_002598 [Prunus dulcis]
MPELLANGLKEETNGLDQGTNSHREGRPGPEKGGNRPENGATGSDQGRTRHEGFFGSDFKPLEDIKEGDHNNAKLWVASDGEEIGLTKRFTEYNPETDNHDPQFELSMKFSNFHVFREAVKEHCLKHENDVYFKRNERYKMKEWAAGVSHMKCYRAKKATLQLIVETVASQYSRLWDYCDEVE